MQGTSNDVAPRSRLLRGLGWSLAWLVVAAIVVLPYLRAYTHLSPFDELVHVDYLVKAGDLDLVRGGEKVGQTAMREQACRGHDIDTLVFPPCGSDSFDAEAFPELGFNTAYPDPPVYYLATAFVSKVVDAVPGIDSVVTAARSVGALWLAAGLMGTFVLSRRLGADVVPSFGAGLLIASTPVVAHASATITSDAPALLIGAGLCLVALEVTRGRISWWWLLPAAALATAIKATSLTVVGAVVVFLLLSARVRGPGGEGASASGSDARVPLLGVLATVLGAAASLVGWTVINSATALGTEDAIPMRTTFRVDSLGWPDFAANIMQLLSPVQSGYLPPGLNSITLALLMSLLNLLLIIAVVASAWLGQPGSEPSRLATASETSMLVSGPALILLIFLGSGSYVPIPHRYGLSLVPPAAACLAVLASRRRVGGPALVALGITSLAALLTQTV